MICFIVNPAGRMRHWFVCRVLCVDDVVVTISLTWFIISWHVYQHHDTLFTWMVIRDVYTHHAHMKCIPSRHHHHSLSLHHSRQRRFSEALHLYVQWQLSWCMTSSHEFSLYFDLGSTPTSSHALINAFVICCLVCSGSPQTRYTWGPLQISFMTFLPPA